MNWPARRIGPAVILAATIASLPLASPAEVSVCLSGPGGSAHPLTGGCGPDSTLLWSSDGYGYAEGGSPCHTDGCGCEYTTQGVPCFTWSVSRSDTDPYATTGVLPDGEVVLYLWLRCATRDQMDIEFRSLAVDVAVTGADVLGTFPAGGVELTGTAGSPVFTADPCVGAQRLVGGLLLSKPTHVGPGTWGRTKARYR